ncbi:MAG: YoaK family protein [Gluconobacter potus]|uniref:YoaK family protein n=2 Tax=Gluconobacter TaxID=441 RepID=UPI0039E7F21A
MVKPIGPDELTTLILNQSKGSLRKEFFIMSRAKITCLSFLIRELIHLVCITLACAITEVICYHDAQHVYAAIMTGNTVELGWDLAAGNLHRALPIAIALGSFFVGCIFASVFQNQLKPVRRIYWLMALLLTAAMILRSNISLRIPIELPLLAFALALQAEGVSQFARVTLQTVVVTNNLVKFAKNFTARYVNPSQDISQIPSREEVLIPGICWVTFCIGAALGGVLIAHLSVPLIVPIGLLVFLGTRSE